MRREWFALAWACFIRPRCPQALTGSLGFDTLKPKRVSRLIWWFTVHTVILSFVPWPSRHCSSNACRIAAEDAWHLAAQAEGAEDICRFIRHAYCLGHMIDLITHGLFTNLTKGAIRPARHVLIQPDVIFHVLPCVYIYICSQNRARTSHEARQPTLLASVLPHYDCLRLAT